MRLTARVVLEHPQVSVPIRQDEPDFALTDQEVGRCDVLAAIVLAEHEELVRLLLHDGRSKRKAIVRILFGS